MFTETNITNIEAEPAAERFSRLKAVAELTGGVLMAAGTVIGVVSSERLAAVLEEGETISLQDAA